MLPDRSQASYCRQDSLIETEASSVNPRIVKQIVLDALMEYAVENITSFYNAIVKDFSVNCNTADCYRALYLYKCREYDDVLHLCEEILKDQDLQDNLKDYSFANLFLLPPIDSFLIWMCSICLDFTHFSITSILRMMIIGKWS